MFDPQDPQQQQAPDNWQPGQGMLQQQPQQPAPQPQAQAPPPDQAPPQNNAQNAGPVKSGLRHVLGQMLSNFSYGAGQSMIKASGGETDAERAMRIAGMAHLNAQTQLLNNQANMTPVQPYGPQGPTLYLPASVAGGYLKQLAANQGKTDTAKISKRFVNVPGVGLYDTQTPDATGNPTKIPDTGAGITITPEIAEQYSLPKEYVGKQMKLTDLGQVQRGQAFQNQVVPGAGGPVVVSKSGPNKGQATPVTLDGQRVGNPQVEARQAGAFYAAKYGLVQSVDEAGNPVYISRLGAAGAPTNTGALQIMKGRAGLDNYRDALTRMSDNIGLLDDGGQRALIAQTMRNIGTIHDPGIISATIGRGISDGLSPQSADLVAAMLQAREFIGANRQFAGNFQGSEALYQRMIGNVPNPMNSAALNRALIQQDLANTTRIEGRMNKFQGSGNPKTPGAPPSSSAGGGFNWDNAPKVK